MPTVVAHHDVKDQQHWLTSPKREEVFGPLGVTDPRIAPLPTQSDGWTPRRAAFREVFAQQ
jgi:hypothetical protein